MAKGTTQLRDRDSHSKHTPKTNKSIVYKNIQNKIENKMPNTNASENRSNESILNCMTTSI